MVRGVSEMNPATLVSESAPKAMRIERIASCRRPPEDSGATKSAASAMKNPYPSISSANMTDPVE